MTTLALTANDTKVLAEIQHFTENLSKKIEDFGEVNSSNTVMAKALKDEATNLEKMIENMRVNIVSPYNDFVKQVNAKAKEYSVPIDKCKQDIVNKIKTYELAMKAEEDRKNKIISDTVRLISLSSTLEDLEKIYSGCEIKNPTIDFAYTQRKNFITNPPDEVKQETETKAILAVENEIVIKPIKTSNTRTMWRMEVIDTNLVPREYCDPNEVRIREAVKN